MGACDILEYQRRVMTTLAVGIRTADSQYDEDVLREQERKIRAFGRDFVPKEGEFLKHNLRLGLTLAVLLAIHIWLSFQTLYVSGWPAGALVLTNGYFMYYFLVLSMHEGTHDLIFLVRSLEAKDRIRKWMPAISTLIGFPASTVYTRDHLLHHAHVSEEDDPQNTAFLNFRSLHKHYFRQKPKYALEHFNANTNRSALLAALALKVGHGYALHAIAGWPGVILGLGLPLLFVAVLNVVRLPFRHYGLYPLPELLRSRSYTFRGASIIAPAGANYHFEHHLCPNVPSYRLNKIYDFVEENCPKVLVDQVHYPVFSIRDFL